MEMVIGSGTTTVIDMDDQEDQPHRDNGFLLAESLPNGAISQTAIPDSAIKKIAIEIAEASAAQAAQPPKLTPEPFKTFLSLVVCMCVNFTSVFTQTYVHDRIPDRSVSPPLPDVVFDLVPRMKWAFYVCEIGMMLMIAANLVNVAFHKHRFIVVRRYLSIIAMAYAMRCVTMTVTSLPVPSSDLLCGKKMFDNIWSKFHRAVGAAIGLGMAVAGHRGGMCGDYMYSGHTISIMNLCLFFSEYTPSRYRLLHFLMWSMGGVCLVLIVLAREHYTVDVLIAVIICSLLFMYYHNMVNTRAHLHRKANRVRVWFPFFYYLEGNVDGVVPNEYEWPFRCSSISWPRCPKLMYRSKSGLLD